MDLRLKSRTALVTGGGSGIGRATVTALLAEGVTVTVLDLAPPPPGLPDGVRWHTGDVTDEESLAEAVRACGGPDIAVGCAGVSGPMGKSPADITHAEFTRTIEVNLTGQFLLAKHASAAMRARGGGAIVFVASDSGFVAAPGMVPYCASKGGVLMLAKALATDLERDGVRVNCVAPSIVDTPMSRTDLGLTEAGFEGQPYPVHRTEEIAAAICYLVSDLARGVNGTAHVMDFGALARSAFPA
ncbi:SDR family NAD(P)-dependent oxidoreductase [Streptomyces sp. NPDC057253]|uniref:SDR family NAD(P)-dependent oxidoreductase n=1 Tax=Streptomyces sp. NPDC057253 TaxID=3346069 RepID=UPI00364005C4